MALASLIYNVATSITSQFCDMHVSTSSDDALLLETTFAQRSRTRFAPQSLVFCLAHQLLFVTFVYAVMAGTTHGKHES